MVSLDSAIQFQRKSLSETVERLSAAVSAVTNTSSSANRPFIHARPTRSIDTIRPTSNLINNECSYNSSQRRFNDKDMAYIVADDRSRTWGSSACYSADASGSEMETGRGDNFELVTSKSIRKL